MKKFQLYLIGALLVVYCCVTLASGSADNRRQFNLTSVTIVKIMENKLTVRNASGVVTTYEISAALRANRFFSQYRTGDKVRIQIQGNMLIKAEGDKVQIDPIPMPHPTKETLPGPMPHPTKETLPGPMPHPTKETLPGPMPHPTRDTLPGPLPHPKR
jgi:hypothetical protein